MSKYTEYNGIDLSQVNQEILKKWDEKQVFQQSLDLRQDAPAFVFYEGPPSANGMPGIHHVISRTLKDVFCRYKTMKGFLVNRKAGWDTHGLPVELGVEKLLGITKEDIGKKISVAEYNHACRQEVLKYTSEWEQLTKEIGYWVDMQNPYVTCDNRYIETLWYLLKQLYKKNLLYKGYTIQPYSPAAGTGLSSHELNQPGCYRDVKDTSAVAQFLLKNPLPEMQGFGDVYALAWTTTPWTLPSNTALCVGPHIIYVAVRTYNPYTGKKMTAILAKDLVSTLFNTKAADIPLEEYQHGDKLIPYQVLDKEWTGEELVGIKYEQLINFVTLHERAFEIITGDYVTTQDGTGIVHIAPVFGADDAKVAKEHNIASLLLVDKDGNTRPMVDLTGKYFKVEDLEPSFVQKQVNLELYGEYAGRYVKNEYDSTIAPNTPTLDVDLCVMLKQANKAFKIEKYTHSYPHCWRTDKPVLYYPLDSWFIRTTAVKDQLIALNSTINWKPQSTGSGRFGKWLENLQDWNLSRSRYWGTPLPIWRTEDGKEEKCIESVAELYREMDKAIAAGVMSKLPWEGFEIGNLQKENYDKIDLHRPYVDDIILVSDSGKPMKREPDLIDVWFDSGAMPFAQMFYPHISESEFEKVYPADFICEGVDQTRGWFFTLHAISTMVNNKVAFKNVISNGLALDKNGNKMSKRLGNAIDPFITINKHGSDPLRWYIITNAAPWDNIKFDLEGVDEVKRKFFGTLYNTYSFFALYANVDQFNTDTPFVEHAQRPEIDRWIISLLNTLVEEVDGHLQNYEPTRAARAISDFVNDNLSNWYVRLNRKRFWGGGMTQDKLSAYQTLFTCLETVARLMAPIAPFYADKLYTDLTHNKVDSVHLTDYPRANVDLIDKQLEERMALAQSITSLSLALRRKVNIKVRQPLQQIMMPVVDAHQRAAIEEVKSLILSEINVKELNFMDGESGILVKRVKPNFKALGPKYGAVMKQLAAYIQKLSQEEIVRLEKEKALTFCIENQSVTITTSDVEIISEDIPGWLVANEGLLTVALDITITPQLKAEGTARELVNRIQNLRKSIGLEITDKVNIFISHNNEVERVLENYHDYIASQVLAVKIESPAEVLEGTDIDMEDYIVKIKIEKT